jgi:hypothetical protein
LARGASLTTFFVTQTDYSGCSSNNHLASAQSRSCLPLPIENITLKRNLSKLLILVSCTALSSSVLASNKNEDRVKSVCRIPVRREGPQSIGAWSLCLRDEINRQWMMQKPHILAEYHCTCNFSLDGDGKLSDLRLLTSSGPAEIDKSFLAAIQQALLLQPNSRQLAHNKKFRMEFDESEHPKIHFKIID